MQHTMASLRTNRISRPTYGRGRVTLRDGTIYRRWTDESLRHENGHQRFGKALKRQVRRARHAE